MLNISLRLPDEFNDDFIGVVYTTVNKTRDEEGNWKGYVLTIGVHTCGKIPDCSEDLEFLLALKEGLHTSIPEV